MIIKGKATKRFKCTPESILLIDNLAIQDLIGIDEFHNQAIICKRNTYFSHAEIFLENISVPVIFLESSDFEKIIDNSILEIDTESRKVTSKGQSYNFSSSLHLNKSETINSESNVIKTADGVNISIELGLRNPNNLELIKNSKINSVKIIHTETINFKTASYKEQYIKYQEICDQLPNKVLAFRLFDFGEDKLFNWVPIKKNEITSFGLRGCRLYDWEGIKDLIRNQVLCLDKLSYDYDIDIIIPYLSGYDDFKSAKEQIYCYASCKKMNIIPMLETVSAFYETPNISKSSKNIIIGTNDLIQSFFASNRNEIRNVDYLNPYKKGLIRFFKFIAKQNLDFTICGNLSLLDYFLSILIGVGFKSFIIPDKYFDSVVAKVKGINQKESEMLVNKIIDSNDCNLIEILKNATPNNV